MLEKKDRKKILVGISGGVDSAVTLALLKANGYHVEAAFLLLSEKQDKANKSLADAKEICKILNVPLKIIDAKLKFRKKVIKYFLDEYSKGRTPNPCIFCNEHIKFKLLLKAAKELKIDYIATGHYAKIKRINKKGKLRYGLFQAKDEKKDQSYFLYRLKQEQLAKILLPLGDYTKEKIRELAKNFNLPVFNKEESQDVCFMDDNDLEEFLAKNVQLKKGKIMNTEGVVIGEHRGLLLYTNGQRKGINIGGSGPYFVVNKNLKKNTLIVTNNSIHEALSKTKINLKQISWIDDCPKLPLTV
ncbi:MAG: tRNA 2-thiouridine(34) synthase MnmA, partial [Candidatus Moraniibacteriota bacterium]